MDTRTILIVEDEAALLYALQSRLSVERYTVVSEPNAENALHQLKGVTPVLIIADIMLPGMNGAAFIERVRANPATATTPIIVMTNLTREDAEQRGIDLHEHTYLYKPDYSLDQLVQAILEHLPKAPHGAPRTHH